MCGATVYQRQSVKLHCFVSKDYAINIPLRKGHNDL